MIELLGLVLETSILVASERRGGSVRDILDQARITQGETDVALSAISVVELTHGIYRARTNRNANGGGFSSRKLSNT